MDILDQNESHLTVSNIGIQEFVESENFCNKQIYPRQRVLLKLFFLEELTSFEEGILDFWIAGGRGGNEITISPNIRERVQYLRDAGFNHFREIVLVGGRRSSKGWVTGVAMAKVLWDTLQLQDPGRHYGIDPEKEIYYSCVAGSEAQAKEFQFADFVSSVESCRAFEPYLVKTLETEFRIATSEDLRKASQAKKRGGKIQRDIAKLRGKALAANAGTLRGSATMAICLDEVAWMVPGVSKASADQVYGAANPSLDQFGKDALLFLNSSPYSKVGLFYERFEAALMDFDPKRSVGDDTNGNPLMMTLQYPSWALFEGYDKDPERRFRKAITVSADWNPDEKKEDGSNKFSGDDQQQILIARTEESANPEKYKVERRGKFAEVTDAYLNPEMVNRAFEGVPVGYDEEGRVLLKPLATNWGYGATNLFKYKAHLDPSSTTAGFGFALGHVEMFNSPQGVPEEHVVFDIVKRWDPRTFPGESIDWRIVITEVMGYLRPYELTLDQFQCLNGDTLIPTTQGVRKLSSLANDLPIGQGAYINCDVQSQREVQKATYLYRRGPSETRKIRLRGGYQIEGTLDHRLWVRKSKKKPWNKNSTPEWVKINEIELGDCLAVKRDNIFSDSEINIEKYYPQKGVYFHTKLKARPWEAYVSKDNKRIRVGFFETKDQAYHARLNWLADYSSRKGCLTPKTLNADIGFVMGALTAEGSVYNDSATFGNSCKEYLDAYVNAAKQTWGGNWFHQLSNRLTMTPQDTVSCGLWASVAIGGDTARMFFDMGLGGVSKEKIVPDCIFHSPKHVITAYLRGLFEGDGGVQVNRTNDEIIHLSTRSQRLANEVQQLLLNLGIYASISCAKGVYREQQTLLYRVKIYGENILKYDKNIGFVSKRKKDTLELACYQILNRENVGIRNKLNQEGDILWCKITSIESSYADCYDLSVPGPESFVANGIISHNSSEPIQHLQYLLQDRGIGGIIVRELVATAENNWNRAETFKTALNHGRIHYPNDTENLELASQELKFLQQRNTGSKYPKVDKQYVGPVQTDDMADCAQEVVSALIGNLIAQQMRERSLNAVMSHGAQGGFRIGGDQRPSLNELHANLPGYYSKGRTGEQSRVEYNTSPQRGKLGGGRRGINRTGRQR
jgi:hypothetical protein